MMPGKDGPAAGPDISGVRLAGLLDTAVDGIIIIDAAARILMYNSACEGLFGYTAAETLGRNVKMLMPEAYAREHDDYLAHYLATGEKRIIGIGREVSALHKDGTSIPVELSVGEAPTSEGRQFIGILRDLRPRIESRRRLEDLQAQVVHMARVSALDEMGATLAHELNQPLTAITLYLDALKRIAGKSDSAIIGSIVDKTVHEAERAGGIIRRLRQFVERRDSERHPVDLRSVVDDATQLAGIGSRPLGIDIRLKCGVEPVPVLADPIQIQQIVINLVRNAIDAMAESGVGSKVLVSCEAGGRFAEIAVEDDGPGIAPDIRDRLFKAFATTKQTGLGIGLAIAHSIAQNHGGELVLDESCETGARFRLRIPRSDGGVDTRANRGTHGR